MNVATKASFHTPAAYEVLATHMGVRLAEVRLTEAARTHAAMADGLARMRALPPSFLEPVLEPGTALRWIERGGRSQP